jgi:PTS system nitrogen regulatory IIA component
MTDLNQDIPLSTLIERGGIYYNLPGTTVEAVITGLIRRLPHLPGRETQAASGEAGLDAALLKAVLEREDLMSTGIGHGIALPHPRSPLITDAGSQFVSAAFPAVPVDWKSLDGKPVHTVLLIVSASPKFHLRTISKINFLCQDRAFLSLLEGRSPPAVLIGAIREAERGWG